MLLNTRTLGGIGIVPQKTDERSHRGADEDDQFLRARHEHDVEVGGIFNVARHIGQDTEGDADEGTIASGHSVHSIIEIGSIGHSGGHDDDH